MKSHTAICVCLWLLATVSVRGQVAHSQSAPASQPTIRVLPRDDGYRGIWYNIGTKYSGGLATYPQQIRPFAIYSEAARKTFFVYGGRPRERNRLLHMISFYDHATGTVPRPAILLDKATTDAHDNPCLAIDGQGYLWIFSNSHGTGRPSYIHRSLRPYDISAFQLVRETNFSYGQPWYLPGNGFLFIHNRYADGRAVAWSTSTDGFLWSEPRLLARIRGHYQISEPDGGQVGVAFNDHPKGLDTRANLYFAITDDGGRTWRNAAGEPLTTPLREVRNPALVHDTEAEGLLVYLKDLRFDAAHHPVILYLTSKGHEPGEQNGPRVWRIAHWTGSEWRRHEVCTSDHNYDFGSLYLEPDGTWRIIAPTDPGPQAGMTGGEVVVWLSRDAGATWSRHQQLTHDSPRNHTYIRRPSHAHPGFYALWADGDAAKASESFLYFTDREGSGVWRLPERMEGDTAKPEKVH